GGLWREVKAFALRNSKTFVWWAFGIIVITVLLPAATKQWADRQAAMTLKSNVISGMYKSAVTATQTSLEAVEMRSQYHARKEARHAWDAWAESVAPIDGVYRVY